MKKALCLGLCGGLTEDAGKEYQAYAALYQAGYTYSEQVEDVLVLSTEPLPEDLLGGDLEISLLNYGFDVVTLLQVVEELHFKREWLSYYLQKTGNPKWKEVLDRL